MAVLVVGLAVLAGPAGAAYATRGAPEIGYRVVRVLPHDRSAFTEGLLWHQGRLYESTGLVGESSLREGDPETGGGGTGRAAGCWESRGAPRRSSARVLRSGMGGSTS